ncbi:MAG: hypothetical protein WC714_19620 [Candidatus Obscuribacterales bacterium]
MSGSALWASSLDLQNWCLFDAYGHTGGLAIGVTYKWRCQSRTISLVLAHTNHIGASSITGPDKQSSRTNTLAQLALAP